MGWRGSEYWETPKSLADLEEEKEGWFELSFRAILFTQGTGKEQLASLSNMCALNSLSRGECWQLGTAICSLTVSPSTSLPPVLLATKISHQPLSVCFAPKLLLYSWFRFRTLQLYPFFLMLPSCQHLPKSGSGGGGWLNKRIAFLF